MRLLLSHQEFRGYGGTETYMLTVAHGLQRLGHEALIFARAEGPMAEFARTRGVQVVAEEGALPERCDAVLAQDGDTACALAVRYPQAARVFVTHSTDHLLQHPPQVPGVCQAVVVLNDRIARHVQARALSPCVVRLAQPIDLDRFRLRGSVTAGPRRVLVLSNYVNAHRREMIETACRDAGLDVVLAGLDGTPTPTPELAIADADVVIGLGRGVLEAMASGRAAYVFGPAGGDGWVTPETYAELEADGFSGRASDRIIDAATLAGDLAQWRRDMGECNRDLASAHHDAFQHSTRLVELVRSLGPPPAVDPGHALEVSRLTRLEQEAEARAILADTLGRGARVEAEGLREEAGLAHAAVRDLHLQLEAARAETERLRLRALAAEGERRQAEQRLAELTASRRVRLAYRLSAPLDRVRRRSSE